MIFIHQYAVYEGTTVCSYMYIHIIINSVLCSCV